MTIILLYSLVHVIIFALFVRLLCLVIVASFSISLVSFKDNLTVLCLVVSYLKTFLYLGLFLLRCFPGLIHQPSNPQIKKNEMVFFIFVGCLVFVYFLLKLHSIIPLFLPLLYMGVSI